MTAAAAVAATPQTHFHQGSGLKGRVFQATLTCFFNMPKSMAGALLVLRSPRSCRRHAAAAVPRRCPRQSRTDARPRRTHACAVRFTLF